MSDKKTATHKGPFESVSSAEKQAEKFGITPQKLSEQYALVEALGLGGPVVSDS